MDNNKKAHIHRLLHFYLSEKVSDPDKVLATIALEAKATPEEVWEVYSEMITVHFYGD